jgi:hypothetical protein
MESDTKKGRTMRSIMRLGAIAALAAALSGCAAVDLAGDAVSAGASVATTGVDVATGVVGTAADTVTGNSKDDDKKSN